MPTTLPFGIRVAAGLVGTSFDRLVKLPGELPGLTVSFAGQLLRTSMRVRQEVAELATRGDELLAPLVGGAQEHPAWATFDEDEAEEAEKTAAGPTPPAAGADRTAAAGDAGGEVGAAAPPNAESQDPTRTLVESLVVDSTVGQSPASEDGGDGEGVNADHSIDLVDLADDADSSGELQNSDGLLDAPDELVFSTSTDPSSAGPDSPILADHPLSVAELKERLPDLDEASVTDLLAQEEAGPNRAPYLTLLTNRLTTLQHENR